MRMLSPFPLGAAARAQIGRRLVLLVGRFLVQFGIDQAVVTQPEWKTAVP